MRIKLKDPQTFRVFFSSPFKGMEEERSELTRKYFPEIQHKCAKIGLQFVPIDMRWGISAESAQKAQTVNICFREIDRSDVFVCFFGQRYGWHGHTDSLLQENIDEALGKYPWVDMYRECSVTEIELRHGHLNKPGVLPAIVCFRDKKFDDIMKERVKDHASNYMCEDDLGRTRIELLRHLVSDTQSQALGVHMDYSNPYEGARLVYEALSRYLSDYALKSSVALSRRQKELAQHNLFSIGRTSMFVSESSSFDFLDLSLSCVLAGGTGDEASHHVLVVGPAGCGKSALLSKWVSGVLSNHKDVIAIPYFVGCAPSTRDPEDVLGFVLGELDFHLDNGNNLTTDDENQFDKVDNSQDNCFNNVLNQTSSSVDEPNFVNTDACLMNSLLNDNDSEDKKRKIKSDVRPKGKELQHQVVKKLELLVTRGHRVVLLFDALNRLVSGGKTNKILHWMPQKLARGVMCVASTDDSDHALINVLLQERGYREHQMQPLSPSSQQIICVQTLKQSGKELSPDQLSRIVSSQQTGNPLFLKIVLSELSIFGSFRKLNEKINSLINVNSIQELLHCCLQRMEDDYNEKCFNGNLVAEILRAIYVSQSGLTENEIMRIFRIPSNVWSPISFAMEYFLISHQGRLGFAFNEIREAIQSRYLPDQSTLSNARQRLILYFDKVRQGVPAWASHQSLSEKQYDHAVTELVWLQRKEESKVELIESLSSISVFRVLNDEHDLELLELWHWTGLKWSDISRRLLNNFDIAIVDCYLATEGQNESTPGRMLRVSLSHMRSFFDLANHLDGAEKVIDREIRILAIEYFNKSMEFHNHNKDKKNEAAALTNLALIYMYKKDFPKSLEMNQLALEAYEQAQFGLMSMDVGNVHTNIGLVHRRMKQLDEAETAYLKSLEIKANAVGWEHPVIATAFMNLGTLEMHRSRYNSAETWTRKAIAVYESNEFPVTKKEYRRCRENLFANMMRQKKHKEVLQLWLEIFEIMMVNGWLEECLAGMHRLMVQYVIENRPDLLDKAEQFCKALIDTENKAHPQNYGHLLSIDQERGIDTERVDRYGLDACLERFPYHSMYETIVELKMELFLLPREDEHGVKKLMRHVTANYLDSNFENIISNITTVSQEAGKEQWWFGCLQSTLGDDRMNKKLLRLFIRLCVHLDRTTDAFTPVNDFLQLHSKQTETNEKGNLHTDNDHSLINRTLSNNTDSVNNALPNGDALSVSDESGYVRDISDAKQSQASSRSFSLTKPADKSSVKWFEANSCQPAVNMDVVEPSVQREVADIGNTLVDTDRLPDDSVMLVDVQVDAADITPARTRVDVAKVVIAIGRFGLARDLLHLVTLSPTVTPELKNEAKELFSTLPEELYDPADQMVTSAA